MSMAKTGKKSDAAVQQKGYSATYNTIRYEAESKWPAWKVSTYNSSVAVSAHAKKVNAK